MAISKTSDLYSLIKSLSKSEKRAFRLFAERIHTSSELLYMQLFDIIDKQKVLNEQAIVEKMGNMNSIQFSNIKRHLFEQLMISLRMVHKSKKPNIQIRELLDFAYILYGKGLYMQSLKILDRAKKLASNHHLDMLILTVIEVEKMIHSRHITRSNLDSLEDLLNDASRKSETILTRIAISNLRLRLHKFYIENGHVKNQAEEKTVRDFFNFKMNNFELEKLAYMEKVHYFQSCIWFYYILNEFEACFSYSAQLIEIFNQEKTLQVRDTNLLMRAYHYLLTSAYNIGDVEKHQKYLTALEDFRKSNYTKFNENTKIISFMYVHLGRLNQYFLTRNFKEGVIMIQRTLHRLARYKDKIDVHKIMIFNYKIAWMYIGNGEAGKAIPYLQAIINTSNSSLRSDIQAYTRILFLMAHTDLGNEFIMPSMIKNFKRYFNKNNIDHQAQFEFLNFFRKYYAADIAQRKVLLKKYLIIFKALNDSKYEKRAFLYLDIIPWMEAKLQGKAIVDC